jgi:putative membrane protein
MNINHTRDLVRMASAYYVRTGVDREVVQQDLERVALATWAFVRAMKRHLSPEWEDEVAFAKEIKEKLPEKQAQAILKAAHRPNRALQGTSSDRSFGTRRVVLLSIFKIVTNTPACCLSLL